MAYKNLAVAKRLEDISQPQSGWYGGIVKRCPERTLESAKFPASLQDAVHVLQNPATMWLANFRSRSATKTKAFANQL